MPATSPQHMARPSPWNATVVCSPLQRVYPVRPVQRSLFAPLPDNQPEILGLLKEICEHQKQRAEQQRHTQECLIAVLSESPEPLNSPILPTCTSSVPVSPVATLSVADPDSPTVPPSQSADHDVIFQLQPWPTSERNYAVQLLRHMFTSSELVGRNVRGVRGKLQLNPEKINKIKDIVFRFFPASLSHQELLWCDCQKQSTPIYVVGK